MRVSYHPDYYVELPPTHLFPMAKYPRAFERLRAAGVVAEHEVMQPEEAPLEALARVHMAEYLVKLEAGALSDQEVRPPQ